MYVPKIFREDSVPVLHALMRERGFATVVSFGPEGLFASHVPVEIDPAPAPLGAIRCHVARQNPHAEMLPAASQVLAIVQVADRYISPGWYPSKRQGGRVVPTWNYVAVHGYGRAAAFDEPDRLRRHLAALVGRNEAGRDPPWTLEDAPADYIEGMCRGIVGFEIALDRLEGKRKLSQNRSASDCAGVVAGLRAAGDDAGLAMAALVEAANPR